MAKAQFRGGAIAMAKIAQDSELKNHLRAMQTSAKDKNNNKNNSKNDNPHDNSEEGQSIDRLSLPSSIYDTPETQAAAQRTGVSLDSRFFFTRLNRDEVMVRHPYMAWIWHQRCQNVTAICAHLLRASVMYLGCDRRITARSLTWQQ